MTLLVQGVTVGVGRIITGVRETVCQDHSASKCIDIDVYKHSLGNAGVCRRR